MNGQSELSETHHFELPAYGRIVFECRQRLAPDEMFVDTHAHLTDERFHDDLPAVIERASAADVRHIVCVATTATDTLRALKSRRNTRRFGPASVFNPTMPRPRWPGIGIR